ncbi:CotH kinase family protein [Wukongibacter baidiensis]|uniref:CotH kinase family protein n=1 Tax=Wukongibacter baidiensis TaxID=1723361 RepID=UPI003D7FE2C0
MRRWMKLGIISVLTCATVYFGIYLFTLYEDFKSQRVLYETYDEASWVNPLEINGITENPDVYKDDEKLEVDSIFVTILKSKDGSENNDNSFKWLLNYNQEDDGPKPKLEIFFEDGDKKLFQNGIFIREPNATLEIRGSSSRKDLQKSFKVRLFDREGLWHNQNIINLNKHYSDSLRIRSRLSYDYLKIIPNITSLRTRFVRLFIKDLSAPAPDDTFKDYGFFTQIEQPNKLFLKSHGLDPNGNLYKAEDFKFQRYPENIKNKKDKSFSKKNFEEILEIKGSEDHKKLIEMLDDVNDYSQDINEVIEKHFDKENYLTWIAINILFDNYERANEDFLLYSPLNSNKWYFMASKFDGAWTLNEDRPKWQKGLQMYWNNVLHKRFFRDPKNIEALNKKIDELSDIVNKKQTKEFLDGYYDIMLSNITKLPDLKYLPITLDDYKREYKELPELTERNRLYYYELLESPMPFNLKEPKYVDNKLIFTWEEAYDIQQDDLYYDFELSKDKDFLTIVKAAKDIKDSKYEIKGLKKGIYYWRVIAKDGKGNSQIAYNIFRDEYGDKYYGLEKFRIDDRMTLSIFGERGTDSESQKDEPTRIDNTTAMTEAKPIEKEVADDELDQLKKGKNSLSDDKDIESDKNTNESYETYTLKAGETLFYVSMRFYGHQGMIEEIRKLNNIEDINNIPTGKLLKLPSK